MVVFWIHRLGSAIEPHFWIKETLHRPQYVYSFNTASGALNWEAQPDSAITASPLVYGDQVLVATESGGVYSFNADGDFEEWYKPADKGKAYTTPVVAGDFVLVAYLESDYYLVALDAESDEKWTFSGK